MKVSGLQNCDTTLLTNAVQVTQTVTISTYFIKMLSILGIQSAKSLTLTATAFAQMRGSQRGPYNVAIVMDTTASMASSDGGSNCTGSKIQCAEQGAQILLSEFSPCLPNTTCGAAAATSGNVAHPVDEVSLFTFPAQTAASLANDLSYNTNTSTSCTGRNPNPGCPSVISYPDTIALTTLPLSQANLSTLDSEYQVTPLSSNYRPSDATATGSNPLTTSSTSPSLVNAIGGNSYFAGTKETGMMALGGVQTFYAGALFTAQQYLAANARVGATNVIILLGDGDANVATFANPSSLHSSGTLKGTYPSSTDECLQVITIANNFKAANSTNRIYVVGYGVASGGCSTDSGATYQGSSITACSALLAMASDQDFFVDTSSVKCPGATSVTMNGATNTLSGIFRAIVGDMTLPRLLPNNPTAIGFTASAL